MNKLGEFETQVYEQMIAEYPAMEGEGKTFTYNVNGRTFKSPEEVTYLTSLSLFSTILTTVFSNKDESITVSIM